MIKRYIAVLIGIVVVVGGYVGIQHVRNVPVDSSDTSPISVTVSEGAGVQEIAGMLKEAGLIRSTWGFLMRAYVSGDRDRLAAGEYTFSYADSGAEIIQRLASGEAHPRDIAVTIPEGFTVKQIADRLQERGIVPAEVFLKAARVEKFRDSHAFLSSAPDGTLEGYLFPDTYRFFPDSEPDVAIQKFLYRFGEQFENVGTVPEGRTVHDVVTMASIIEREVIEDEDRRIVSGILWKRLSEGMRLDADATTRYAIDNWERPLTVSDLQTDSPYNTRLHGGLPPGPIGNPGFSALFAALNPEPSEYYYYLSAREDGATIFSKTLEQHNKNKKIFLSP